MNIQILNRCRPPIPGVLRWGCDCKDCDCLISFNSKHFEAGDIATIGDFSSVKAKTTDIIQDVADSFIEMGWAKEV